MHRPLNTEATKQPEHDQIMTALNAVLASDKFTAAPQMSAFLRYVVEQAASGNMTRIKAYTVAIDALGKPDSFDPQNDPVVRVLAGRLRAALSSYYDANPDTDLRITMRPGSYVPSFVQSGSIDASEKSNSAAIGRTSSVEPTPTTKTTGSPSLPDSLSKTSTANTSSPLKDSKGVDLPSSGLSENNSEATANNKSAPSDRSFTAHLHRLFRLPAAGIALVALGIFAGSQLSQFKTASVSEVTVLNDDAPRLLKRDRPEQVSLFVSALEQGNSLNDQLNTMLSGVFSESTGLYVYRVFDSNLSRQHWPEDYLVSVDILPLPTETRVNVQLLEAQTGRVSHSEHIALSKNAAEGLNGEELVTITEFARQLISENGPLFNDYKTKLSLAKSY